MVEVMLELGSDVPYLLSCVDESHRALIGAYTTDFDQSVKFRELPEYKEFVALLFATYFADKLPRGLRVIEVILGRRKRAKLVKPWHQPFFEKWKRYRADQIFNLNFTQKKFEWGGLPFSDYVLTILVNLSDPSSLLPVSKQVAISRLPLAKVQGPSSIRNIISGAPLPLPEVARQAKIAVKDIQHLLNDRLEVEICLASFVNMGFMNISGVDSPVVSSLRPPHEGWSFRLAGEDSLTLTSLQGYGFFGPVGECWGFQLYPSLVDGRVEWLPAPERHGFTRDMVYHILKALEHLATKKDKTDFESDMFALWLRYFPAYWLVYQTSLSLETFIEEIPHIVGLLELRLQG
jgi:hypothetical protein